ncbi:MAG: DegT/DnrJ/EryC1/StrS family aminotransferase [Candidatus Omnitrophica bacterium]|nr:DegT/DnrJ/EryC1/StrS family aminotransferase [Candidatus Omnitrophota bacterium]MDD5488759.1 DegT/DnrJ/EryC1/StrS family aminotransferase [Candidatus Omnitrophota bacterium]
MIRFLNNTEIARPNVERKTSILAGMSEVLDSGEYISGKYVEEFEKKFAEYCGGRFCVSVNSGTDALVLSLKSAGIGPGNIVLVPAVSFIATAFAPLLVGARIRFADIDPNTYNIAPDALTSEALEGVAAVIPVHWAGRPVDMEAIGSRLSGKGISVVEDAAQAAGARYGGRPVGSSGNYTAFSFFPTKNLSCMGDGGAIVVGNAVDKDKLRLLRNFGRSGREEFLIPGQNSRLDEIQAVVLLEKLKDIERYNERRREIAALYDRYLDKDILRPIPADVPGHAYHLYVVLVPGDRDRIAEEMLRKGVETAVHYRRSLHEHLRGMGVEFEQSAPLRNAEYYSDKCLSLPMYPYLSEEQVQEVSERLNELI